MNKFFKIISKLRPVAMALISLLILLCVIFYGSFLIIKYNGPVSPKFLTGFTESILERSIQDSKIKISHIKLAIVDNLVDFTVFDLKITYGSNTAIIPYVRADIDVFKIITGRIKDSFSNLSFSYDIEIQKEDGMKNIIIGRIHKNIAKIIKDYLINNVDFINNVTTALKGVNFKIREFNEDNALIVTLENIDFKQIDNNIFHFKGELTSGNDFISCDGEINANNRDSIDINGNIYFVPISLLWLGSEHYSKIQSNLKVDFSLNAKIDQNGLKDFNFNLINYNGFIQKNDYLQQDILLKEFSLSGKWSNKTGLNIDAYLGADDLILNASLEKKDNKLNTKISASKMQLKSFINYWPLFILKIRLI